MCSIKERKKTERKRGGHENVRTSEKCIHIATFETELFIVDVQLISLGVFNKLVASFPVLSRSMNSIHSIGPERDPPTFGS